MFEAQLTVLAVEEVKKRDTLLCLLERNAFTCAAQFIATNNNSTYTQLKEELKRLFSGDDYRRALETKIRSLLFKSDTNIPVFCNELRVIITELFGITDSATIEKIAINDVLSKFDGSLREKLKVLQLAGTCKLESLLELAKSMMGEENLTNTYSSTSSGDCSRIDRLGVLGARIAGAERDQHALDRCSVWVHDASGELCRRGGQRRRGQRCG